MACLADPAPHIGQAYRPTGPKLLAPSDIAEAMGKALGRRVKYQDVPLPMFLKAARSLGISDFVISQLYWFLQDYQAGAFGIGAPIGAVEQVTPRKIFSRSRGAMYRPPRARCGVFRARCTRSQACWPL